MFSQYLHKYFRYDKQLQQIDGTLSTIEMQREALEGANTNTAVLETMNNAAKALKVANNKLDVDQVTDNIICLLKSTIDVLLGS